MKSTSYLLAKKIIKRDKNFILQIKVLKEDGQEEYQDAGEFSNAADALKAFHYRIYTSGGS